MTLYYKLKENIKNAFRTKQYIHFYSCTQLITNNSKTHIHFKAYLNSYIGNEIFYIM